MSSYLFEGKFITKLRASNPRRTPDESRTDKATIRNKSNGYYSWKLLSDGDSYEEYIKKGGRPKDLRCDYDRDRIALSDTREEALAKALPQAEAEDVAEEETEYKPDDLPDSDELYGVDDIVKNGCFMTRAELENILGPLRSKKTSFYKVLPAPEKHG